MLSETQIERYSRQIVLPQVGGAGQERLLAASLAVWGSGSLARTAAGYLAAAGVGALRLAPELAADVDGLNPDCRVGVLAPLTARPDAAAAVRGMDAVLAAGAGEVACRWLNAACLADQVPLVWGDAGARTGCCMVLAHPAVGTACYDCRPRWRGSKKPVVAAAPVAAAVIGTVMATEAIKKILGVGRLITDRLLVYDASANAVGEVAVSRRRACRTCGARLHGPRG